MGAATSRSGPVAVVTHTPRAPAPAEPSGSLPHLRALDGLRGAAVTLVVLYHLAPTVLPGAFLSMDAFFVLSGFLITSLLVHEATVTGGVDLRVFYMRRARRLAPALLLVIAALAAYAALWATPGELLRLRDHSLWTLGYLANWNLIADGTTYTEVVTGQSPLRHTWSLAIEEQFYLVLPIVVIGLGRALGWRPGALRRALVVVSVLGALASAAWMAILWGDGHDFSRGYFGSDTRAQSLLVGVGLGALLVGRPPKTGRAARVAGAAGATGVVVLVLAMLTSQEDSAWVQHGGFLLVAVSVAGLISALERSAWLRRVLSVAPLVFLGLISYGVYLWHWPIIVLVDEPRTGLSGPALAVVRVGMTLIIALASYRLVELPIRHGALGRHLGRVATVVGPAVAVAVVIAVLATTAPRLPSSAQLVASNGPPIPSAPAENSPPDGSPPVDVVVFGDSVAHTLAGGPYRGPLDWDPWSPEQSPFDPDRVNLWAVTLPSCSFLPGLVKLEDMAPPADLSKLCGDWRQGLAQVLDVLPGSVVVVMLANDASDRWVDGSTVDLGSSAHAALLGRFLDELVRLAEPTDSTIALVPLPPRTGRFARAIDEGGRREAMFREELRDYAGRHAEVQLLDLHGDVCSDGACSRPGGGFDASFRDDGLHFNADGAQWFARWLTERLTGPAALNP